MKYPEHCDTSEKKESLLRAIAMDCYEFLKRGDRFWVPYKGDTLYELLITGHLTQIEYDFIRKNQREWEEHYRTHLFSHDRATQERFEAAYNYRDW
jgi:hypothetical protein